MQLVKWRWNKKLKLFDFKAKLIIISNAKRALHTQLRLNSGPAKNIIQMRSYAAVTDEKARIKINWKIRSLFQADIRKECYYRHEIRM